MPELPEVETVLRTLETKIKGQRIEDIRVLYPNIVSMNQEDFRKKLIHQHFSDFKRRGKYLLFEMDDCTFVSHLRMEGKYYILPKDTPIDKHTHVIFELDNGMELRYHDVRKFGRMEIIGKYDYVQFKDLGPEPFSADFNIQYVKDFLHGVKKPIKEVLLGQDFVAGVGNIYADEILFASGIKPTRTAGNLTVKEIEEIIINTKEILEEAIKQGGTTIRSYTSSLGVTGRFQQSLKVHTIKECPICKNPIKKIRVAGRGTYYCSICQK